ncbi:MAG TPA: DUF192 domain-containing protein [Candidatus Sulfotelmatobacter sp.]
MTVVYSQGQAFNRTRQAYLATELALANTHWSRLCGLMGASSADFAQGRGLWIVPCHGVHTLAMRFPIDVVYLSSDRTVVHVEKQLRPWRFAPIRMQAATVLELPSGKAVETQTSVGDKIDINMAPFQRADLSTNAGKMPALQE